MQFRPCYTFLTLQNCVLYAICIAIKLVNWKCINQTSNGLSPRPASVNITSITYQNIIFVVVAVFVFKKFIHTNRENYKNNISISALAYCVWIDREQTKLTDWTNANMQMRCASYSLLLLLLLSLLLLFLLMVERAWWSSSSSSSAAYRLADASCLLRELHTSDVGQQRCQAGRTRVLLTSFLS